MKRYTRGMHGMIFIVLILLAACWGCAGRQVAKCTSPEDNVQVHYAAGMETRRERRLPGGPSKAGTGNLLQCGLPSRV